MNTHSHIIHIYSASVRAGSVLELDVRLNSVSFHKEFRKETGKHGQIIMHRPVDDAG